MTPYFGYLFFCATIIMLASISSDPFQMQALVKKVASAESELIATHQLLQSAFPGAHIPTICADYHQVHVNLMIDINYFKRIDLRDVMDYRTPSVSISMALKLLRSKVNECIGIRPLNHPLITN